MTTATEIHGVCDDRFASVRDAMSSNFEQGLDVGASVAVTVDGELLVDLWGGHTDEARTTPWDRDTITNVWSTTKTMTALCALILADSGGIDLHAPVARYWPEFAAGGKGGVEVRHLLGHTSGLSGWQEPITVETLYDWAAFHITTCRPGAVVGAGQRLRLPCRQPGPSRRRGDSPGYRSNCG
jgi:CubicO group peptidase (beta-lactamase class C family)